MTPASTKLRSAIVATSITAITLAGLVTGFRLETPGKPRQALSAQGTSESQSPIHATLAELSRTRDREVAKKLDLQRKIAEVEAMVERRQRDNAAVTSRDGGG
jgi:hypothetical protein